MIFECRLPVSCLKSQLAPKVSAAFDRLPQVAFVRVKGKVACTFADGRVLVSGRYHKHKELKALEPKARRNQVTEILHNFEKVHKEDVETITQVLVKITCRPPEEIKPYLHTMLEQLVKPKERPFYETATPSERARAFREWAESHDQNSTLLSDYAVSRESMYDDKRL